MTWHILYISGYALLKYIIKNFDSFRIVQRKSEVEQKM